MPYSITDDCVACGGCAVVCPENAIDDGYNPRLLGDLTPTTGGEPLQTSRFYRITGACTGCGTCMDVCPTGAIVRK